MWGTETLSYRSALLLATLATLAGSVASVLLSSELLRSFSGAGLIPDEIASGPHFASAVAVGAAITVMTATRLGFPISTTHAISGAILGVGATRRLSAVRWGIAGRIVSAWVLTIPGCFAFGWAAASLLQLLGVHT